MHAGLASTRAADQQLSQWKAQVDTALDRVITSLGETDPLDSFADAIRYSLLGPGKRVRPALVLAAAEACGVDGEVALPVAAAFELVHAYSLVHDDLPAMDDDDMRRGRATSHRVYGEAVAILVGNALQAEAYALISTAEHVSAEARCELVTLLATQAGWRGMVGGQFLDIAPERDRYDAAALREVHMRKTGALMAAAVQAGAIIGGIDAAARQSFAAFGSSLGWLFQLVDDILDVVGDQAQTGRPLGSDERSDRVTAMAVFGGVDGARAAADAELAQCEQIAGALPGGGGALPSIARYVHGRDVR